MDLRTLIDKRNALIRQSRDIIDAAPADGFTPEQRSRLENLDKAIEQLQKDIDLNTKAETREGAQRRSGADAPRNDPGGRRTTRDVAPGEARFLTSAQSFARDDANDLPHGMKPSDLSFGRWFRGIVTGDWKHADAERELHERRSGQGGSIGTVGGYLVPAAIAGQVIDLARSKTVVMQAGALTIDMPAEQLRVARVDGDPSASWRAENTLIATSTMLFGGIELRARNLGCMLKISRELLQDAPNVGDVASNALAQQMALSWDFAALLGSGAGEQPLGLRYSEGVALSTSTGGPVSGSGYDPFIRALLDIENAANGEANAAIFNPRTYFRYHGQLKDGQNNPLEQPEPYKKLEKFRTSAIPTNSTTYGSTAGETTIFFGDFSKLLVGVRQGLEIDFAQTASDASGNGFPRNQVLARATFRGDIGVAVPAFFECIVGSTA